MKQYTREKKISILDKAGFFFFISFCFFLPISNAAIEISFSLLVLCFVIKTRLEGFNIEKAKDFFKQRINLSLLVFYIAIGISLFAGGPFLAKGFEAWFFKWGEGVVLFYLAQVFLDRRRVMILLKVFVFSSLLLSIDGIYQWVYGTGFIRGFDMTEVAGRFSAVRATFNHYNDFASFLAVVFILNLIFLLQVKKIYLKVFFSLLLSLIVINLLLTHSRGALLALFCGLAVFLLVFPGKKYKRVFVLVMAISAAAVILLPPGRYLVAEFIQRADAGRFYIWFHAFNIFKESPFIGTGLGTFMDRISTQGLEPMYAHNCYLQILAETGLLGLLSFLWFLTEIMLKALRRLGSYFALGFLGLFSALVVLLVHIFFDTQLYSLKLSLFFWLLTSFAVIYSLRADNEEGVLSDNIDRSNF